jgi:hypothetical protein
LELTRLTAAATTSGGYRALDSGLAEASDDQAAFYVGGGGGGSERIRTIHSGGSDDDPEAQAAALATSPAERPSPSPRLGKATSAPTLARRDPHPRLDAAQASALVAALARSAAGLQGQTGDRSGFDDTVHALERDGNDEGGKHGRGRWGPFPCLLPKFKSLPTLCFFSTRSLVPFPTLLPCFPSPVHKLLRVVSGTPNQWPERERERLLVHAAELQQTVPGGVGALGRRLPRATAKLNRKSPP